MSLYGGLLGQRIFSEEFKAKAVRQVIERGYRVSDVAARVGVSAHSPYKWTRASRPTKAARESTDLDTTMAEIAKLKSQLRRTEEERDIPKKGRRVLYQRAPVEYAFIQAHRNEFRVATMCRVLRVTRSGYYA